MTPTYKVSSELSTRRLKWHVYEQLFQNSAQQVFFFICGVSCKCNNVAQWMICVVWCGWACGKVEMASRVFYCVLPSPFYVVPAKVRLSQVIWVRIQGSACFSAPFLLHLYRLPLGRCTEIMHNKTIPCRTIYRCITYQKCFTCLLRIIHRYSTRTESKLYMQRGEAWESWHFESYWYREQCPNFSNITQALVDILIYWFSS